MKEGNVAATAKPTIDDFVHRYAGGRYFDPEKALAYLLNNDIVFINSRRFLNDPQDKTSSDGPTIVVFANCSDVFAWGGADAENIDFNHHNFEGSDLYKLLSYVLEDAKWGSTKYACERRNMQPQKPVADRLKEDGVWSDWWEALPPNWDRAGSAT